MDRTFEAAEYGQSLYYYGAKDGCTEQDICSFDSLEFKHKVIFTVKEYPQYRSAYYIPKSEADIQNVKNLCDYQSKFTGKRWLDEFDWISFLNER